jgi:hypothetical protein
MWSEKVVTLSLKHGLYFLQVAPKTMVLLDFEDEDDLSFLFQSLK